MKNQFFLPLLLLGSGFASAQNDTIWLDAYDRKVSPKDATYYRLSKPVQKRFEVSKYKVDHTIYSKGMVENLDGDSLNYLGLFQAYDSQGRLLNTMNYVDGKIEGTVISTLKDGTRYEATFVNNVPHQGQVVYDYYNVYMLMVIAEGNPVQAQIFAKDRDSYTQIIFFNQDGSYDREETYNPQGDLIGTCSYNGYQAADGKSFEFFYNPISPRSMSTYQGEVLLKKESFYRDGNLKEQIVYQDNIATSTYYDKSKNLLSTYKEQIDADYQNLAYQGKQMVFNYADGLEDQILTVNTYADGELSQVDNYSDAGKLKNIYYYTGSYNLVKAEYFDAAGNKESQLIYDEYGSPLDGIEKSETGILEYRAGKLVSSKEFYADGKLFASMKNSKKTFYDSKNKVIGELTYKDEDGYSTPVNGTYFSQTEGYIDAEIHYGNGQTLKSIEYKLNSQGRHLKVSESIYKDGALIKETRYQDNGKILSENSYKDYSLYKSVFYDAKGVVISNFDHLEMNGTLYEYFASTDVVESISKYEKGNLVYQKKFVKEDPYSYLALGKVYVQSEVDFNKKGVFYKLGQKVAEATYKSGLPWQGQVITSDDYYLATTSNYTDGVKDGEEVSTSIYNDEVQTRNFYNRGNLEFTESFSEGVLSSRIPYVNEMYNGEALYFNESGEEINRVIYKDNEIFQGVMTTESYDSTRVETYEEGVRVHLVCKSQDQLQYQIEKVDADAQYYKVQIYDEQGQLIHLFHTLDDQLHGSAIAYDSKGKVKHQAELKEGYLVSGSILLATNSYYDEDEAPHLLLSRKKDHYRVKAYNAQEELLYTSDIQLKKESKDLQIFSVPMPFTANQIHPSIEKRYPGYFY